MTDLENAIEKHLQELLGYALRAGQLVPTVSLFFAEKKEVNVSRFQFADDDEKQELLGELRETIRETQPDAAVLMLEAFTRSTKDPQRKDAVIAMVEFPSRPRFIKAYDCEYKDGKLVDLHPHGIVENIKIYGMELFDPPTTH